MGGWIKNISYTNPHNILITIDPIMIDEIEEEKDDLDGDISEAKLSSPLRRLRGGGIEVSYSVISSITEMCLPYPQIDEGFRT